MNSKNIAGAVVPVNRLKEWREGEKVPASRVILIENYNFDMKFIYIIFS